MPRYNVPLTGWANITVTVETDETDETDPEEIARLAEANAFASLCHQCSGERNSSLEIGDQWEATTHEGKPEIYPAS